MNPKPHRKPEYLASAALLLLALASAALCQPACPEWTDPHAKVVEIGPSADLVAAVRDAASGTTLLLQPGTYKVGASLQFTRDDVTLRGKTGKREDVVIDGYTGTGAGTGAGAVGSYTAEVIAVSASRITLADFSVKRARYHAIHAYPPRERAVSRLRIRNAHISDAGQQLIKINSNGQANAYWVDSGTVECSWIGFNDNSIMQAQGDGYYTGGIDMHGGRGWTFRNNLFKNIQRDGKLMEHGIHLWSKSRDAVIENNRFEDVCRGIGLGMKTSPYGPERKYPDGKGDSPYSDFIGAVVRNNVVHNRAGIHLEVGIELMNVIDVEVYHNTVVSLAAPFNSIEYRWPNTRVNLRNNIASHRITARDGGQADAAANLQNAGNAPFVAAASGDLHLLPGFAAAVDKGVKLAAGKADRDFDMDNRDAAPDIGADEVRLIPTGLSAPRLRHSPASPGYGLAGPAMVFRREAGAQGFQADGSTLPEVR